MLAKSWLSFASLRISSSWFVEAAVVVPSVPLFISFCASSNSSCKVTSLSSSLPIAANSPPTPSSSMGKLLLRSKISVTLRGASLAGMAKSLSNTETKVLPITGSTKSGLMTGRRLNDGWTVGTAVGTRVGSTDGSPVGSLVGVSVGSPVGNSVDNPVGFVVGFPLGSWVGKDVGASLGLKVGEVLGLKVGELVGFNVGSVVGSVPSDEGSIVGCTVGAVGDELGSTVGSNVGERDGSRVGSAVGI